MPTSRKWRPTRASKARRASGVSQQRLGEELGVTAGMIHGYEHGDYRMSAGALAAAARVVERDVAWFFGEGAGHG